MRTGLCYDLREDYLAQGFDDEQTAEFDSPQTIAALERALRAHGLEVTRIGNVRALADRLVRGERWDIVFNICEGLHGVAREAQVPALLEAYDLPYVFSDPLTMALTLDKAMAKHVVRDNGVATADFAVIAGPEDLERKRFHFPVFAKPLAEGTGKGIDAASLATDPAALAETCTRLMHRHAQPVLVERYLPGREFTVGIIGSGAGARALGVMEIEFLARAEAHGYSFSNKEHYEDRVRYRLVEDSEARRAAATALAAWRALGCRDGGRVDLRSDARSLPHFLEVNPLAGLHPERSDLVILARLAGLDYNALIGEILAAATARLGSILPERLLREAV